MSTLFENKEEMEELYERKDMEDTGAVFSGVDELKLSTTSILTAEDRATQQMIFDRLPLSKTNRHLFYKWLIEENQDDIQQCFEAESSDENDVERSTETTST